MKLILESFAQVNESGTKIGGLALTPRISRNHNFYFPSQLERADGKVVPLRWEHGGESTNIGEAVFHYDPELMQLNYEAIITNEEAAKQVRNRKLFVSIGAAVGVQQEVCDQSKNCYIAPQELKFEELSIVEVAGIPESTVSIIEKLQVRVSQIEEACPEESSITSVNDESSNPSNNMVQETDKVTELECPEGQKEVDGECVPNTTEPQAETKSKEMECPEGQKEVDGECKPEAPASSDAEKKSEQKIENKPFDADAFKKEMLSSVKSTVGEALTEFGKANKAQENYRIAQISPENGSFTKDDMQELTRKGWNALEKYGFFKYEVNAGTKALGKASNKITEALSFASTQSSVDVEASIDVVPAGLTDLNIIPYVKYKDIKDGSDTARFLKGSIPASGTITEGSAATPVTHTITPVNVTADTIKGWAQIVDYAEIEDTPADLFAYLTATARASYLDDVATLVLDTTATAATPLKWVRADTQVVITDDDIDAVVFDYKSISYAREQLVDRGFSSDRLVAFLHPRQYRELVNDSDLSTLVQQGDATIAKSGKLDRLFGVEIVETNAVTNVTAQTNTAYQAIVCVKGHTFAVASKRKIKIEITSDADEFAKKVGYSHRTGAGMYDSNSMIRISSSSD